MMSLRGMGGATMAARFVRPQLTTLRATSPFAKRQLHHARPITVTALSATTPSISLYSVKTLHHQLTLRSPAAPRRGLHDFHVHSPSVTPRASKRERRSRKLRNLAIVLGLLSLLYYTYSPFRHSVIAVVRCARVMEAVTADILDYKKVFAVEDQLAGLGRDLTDEEMERKRQARRECHTRSAKRMLAALDKNSGIYVKLGQHVAAVQVLPKEWTETMRPLQDQCFPTPLSKTDDMLREDLGEGVDELFTDFDPNPIGVASLAQVHRAIDKRSGKPVAVKVQHADLQEFAAVDMATVNFAIRFVKYVFPEFEFSWLGSEMNEMLPLEMDFRHEAANSSRCKGEFSHLKGKTSLYLPNVLWAEKRCMVMEYIEGARVDDLVYLKKHHIDRNQVSQELSRIFSQMVYLNGHFHADPHHGNILVRPKAPGSTSPFNFDICLLDHGQYFDIPDDLRVNYAHFWLSLIKSSSEKTISERRHYAKLVGNIDGDMYPILESAITGQINMADDINTHDSANDPRPKSLLDAKTFDKDQIKKLRQAMLEKEGLIASIFELLRVVPRRMLMILKLSDLQRSLDQSLHTTHGQSRVFVIVAQYCAKSIWQGDVATFKRSLSVEGFSFKALRSFVGACFNYVYWNTSLSIVELALDMRASSVKVGLWLDGLGKGGLKAAEDEMAGLPLTITQAA